MFYKYTALIITATFLQGCDPVFQVVISNKSPSEKNIVVGYPKYVTQPPEDTLLAFTNTLGRRNVQLHKIPLQSKDTAFRKYSFILPPGLDAFVGMNDLGHLKYPMFGQVAIINNKDTVMLNRRKLHHRFQFLGGQWIYTIRE